MILVVIFTKLSALHSTACGHHGTIAIAACPGVRISEVSGIFSVGVAMHILLLSATKALLDFSLSVRLRERLTRG